MRIAARARCAVIDECRHFGRYIDNELKPLVTEGDSDTRPTAGFQRVVQHAVRSAEGLE